MPSCVLNLHPFPWLPDVKCRYDFVPPVKYNFLDADEAEERFEQRNKTLNYFSIMLSKKLKDSEDGDEDGAGGSDGKEARSKEKKKAADSGLVMTSVCLCCVEVKSYTLG